MDIREVRTAIIKTTDDMMSVRERELRDLINFELNISDKALEDTLKTILSVSQFTDIEVIGDIIKQYMPELGSEVDRILNL